MNFLHEINQATTDEVMSWVAYLRDGTKIFEGQVTGKTPEGKDSFSTDFLPVQDVVAIGYIPMMNHSLPRILCEIDVDAGERFERYWSSVWFQGKGMKRLYALGWSWNTNGVRNYSLLYYYPMDNRICFSNNRVAGPPFVPDTMKMLTPDCILHKDTQSVGWTYKGRPSWLINLPGGLLFRSKK